MRKLNDLLKNSYYLTQEDLKLICDALSWYKETSPFSNEINERIASLAEELDAYIK